MACYCSSPGTLPASWTTQTFWQYADSGTFPGDQNLFNGTPDRLTALATGAAGSTTSLAATVTTLERDTASCPGQDQFLQATDSAGVPIEWTYANGTNACVRVGYAPKPTTTTCGFSFYVPAGHATARIAFGYWTADGMKHYANLDEAPVTGWQPVFSAANVTRIEFQDNNGQAYPAQLGWATAAAYGFRQSC